jgi:RNA polymerase sigma factor (sigma-70 family)
MILPHLRPDTRETSLLVERCLKGDENAWSTLVDRYAQLVYSIPHRYGLCDADIDDVVQDVFILLHQQMRSIRDRSRLSAWLITTTHRECWRLGRRRRSDCALHDRWPDSSEPPPEQAERWQREQMVREAMRRLAPRDRWVLEALFLEPGGSGYEAVGGRLGMRHGSIGPTRARCLEKLEQILVELGQEPTVFGSPLNPRALVRRARPAAGGVPSWARPTLRRRRARLR